MKSGYRLRPFSRIFMKLVEVCTKLVRQIAQFPGTSRIINFYHYACSLVLRIVTLISFCNLNLVLT